MEKNNSSLRYVAGACFGIDAILTIIRLVQNAQNGFSFMFNAWALLTPVGEVLIAIAMFASIPMLIAVGGGVSAVFSARILIIRLRIISHLGSMDYVFVRPFIDEVFIDALFLLVVWILIIVSGVNKKSGKTLAMIAGALSTLRFFVYIFGNKLNYGSFRLSATGYLRFLVIIVGAFMIGLASESLPSDEKAVVKTSANAGTNATSAESQVEKLTKLKTLLDSGVISQEEFDAKKKQILGL